MIVGLLSLQSRAWRTPKPLRNWPSRPIAWPRSGASTSVSSIHIDQTGVQTVAFKQYLEDLCRDFSTMLSSEECPERVIVVEGIEIKLPTVTGVPLGFIVNELITNAAKYGKRRITVRLERRSRRGLRAVGRR